MSTADGPQAPHNTIRQSRDGLLYIYFCAKSAPSDLVLQLASVAAVSNSFDSGIPHQLRVTRLWRSGNLFFFVPLQSRLGLSRIVGQPCGGNLTAEYAEHLARPVETFGMATSWFPMLTVPFVTDCSVYGPVMGSNSLQLSSRTVSYRFSVYAVSCSVAALCEL